MKYKNDDFVMKAIQIVSTEMNIPAERFLSNSHTVDLVLARHFLRMALVETNRYNMLQVSQMFNLNHTTVLNSRDFINNIRDTEPDLYAKYNIIRVMIMNELDPTFITRIENDVVYIAGKITGLPADFVERKFAKTETELLKKHKVVINPYSYCKELGITGWNECMRALLPLIADCSVMYVQADYLNSRGALWEIAIAKNIYGIQVVRL